ncbi:cytosolic carboxypeptidase 6-like isoform X2 [Rhodnius prolixus]
MGNVTRVVMRPPGHSGKAKKGHLCFDASFETGNLGLVELVSQYEYDLYIRPDTCNPRLRLWFNFTVDNTKPDQRVVFNIVNFGKKKNCFLEGMTPLVKSTSRPNWQRMPDENVFYHSSPYHSGNYVLSVAFNFDREEDVYQFALCYPYSYSRCQTHLDILEKKGLLHFQRELLGESLQNRRVDLITITHPKNMVPEGKRHVVVILSRVHPGESPASYVCQGLIDFLVSNHSVARALREKVIFKIIPMLNPDGVFLGNYRCSQVGQDLNRNWSKISKWMHPTVHAAYSYISSLDQDKNIELDIVLDLHAHSNLRGAFITGNTYNDVYRYERHIVFPKLLSQTVLGYEATHSVFNRDVNKSGTARRVLCDTMRDSVNCYSLIVSYFGYNNHSITSNFKYYTEDTYFKVGRNVVEALLEYYRTLGICERIKKKESKSSTSLRPVGSAIWRCRSSRVFERRRHSAPLAHRTLTLLGVLEQPKVASHRILSRPSRYYKGLTNRFKSFKKAQEYQNQPALSIIDFNRMTLLDEAGSCKKLP